MSPTANIDNPIFSPNTGVRYAITSSEIQTAAFFAENSEGNISSDYDFFTNPSSSIPMNYYNVEENSILSLDNSLYTGNFDHNGFIIIRDQIVNNPFRLLGQRYKINYDPKENLYDQDFSKIYDSNSASGFV